MHHSHSLSRRDLLKSGALAAASLSAVGESFAAGGASGAGGNGDPWRGLKLGVATYTFRKFPTEAAIKGLRRVGVQYVSLKDVHVPLKGTPEERRAGAQRFRDAGLTPLSCGNLDFLNDEANVRQFFEYARDIGVPTIVCTPHRDSLPILDRMVKEFGIRLAIHNHGPGKQWATPDDVWRAVEPYDRRIGLCIDVGHTARAGVDPAGAIIKCRERLYDLHVKDLSSTAPNATNVEIGRGALDLRAVFQALLRIKYQHLVGIEYEKDQEDPLPGLAESVGYLRGLLSEGRV
jgi:inosose dehydratase